MKTLYKTKNKKVIQVKGAITQASLNALIKCGYVVIFR
jgi:hypothetical protein